MFGSIPSLETDKTRIAAVMTGTAGADKISKLIKWIPPFDMFAVCGLWLPVLELPPSHNAWSEILYTDSTGRLVPPNKTL